MARSVRRAGTLQQQQEYTRALQQQIYEAMADAPPESPESKSLREKAESLERMLAAARAAHAARQQAKADANDDDGDAKMLPPIEELAVTGAADDAAAQPKESSDESSDDDSRRVAQKKTSDATTTRSRPATPDVARDAMAADWSLHPTANQLWEKLQSQQPPEETGEILALHVQRETHVPLDGPNFGDPYAGYKNSQACFDANQRRVNYRAALDAADALRAHCDLCAKELVDDDFDVGDIVAVGDERGVVTALQANSYWKVRVGDEDKPRSLRTGEFTSPDGGATGICFRLGCGRERCASCQAVNPLKAPLLCQGCPEGVFLPYKAQTVERQGAPELFGAFSLSAGLRAELAKAAPDVHQVIWHLERELGYMLCPDDVKLSDQLFMDALKERLLRMDRVGRWLGDLDLGVTYWRVCETVEESLAAWTLPSSRARSLFITFYVAQAHRRGPQGRAREGRRVVPGQLREGQVPRGRQLRDLRYITRGLRRGRQGIPDAAREAGPGRRC